MNDVVKKPFFNTTKIYYGMVFISLLLSIFISVSIIGNRTESAIKSYQTKTTTQQAELYLQNISRLIETNIQLVSDLSRTPILANAVMGSNVSMIALHDRLDELVLLGNREDVILVNIIGEIIHNSHTQEAETTSLNIKAQWLSDVLEEKSPYTVTTTNEDGVTKLRVTYPVKYNNFTEGALIVIFQKPLEDTLTKVSEDGEKRQGFILSSDDAYFTNLPTNESFLSVYKQAVGDSGLTLEYFIDGEAINRDANTIQRDLALSIITSLIISFVVLGLIGRQYLLNPFKQLEVVSERNKLFATVIDSSPVGISIADATKDDMPLTYVNNAFVDMTGFSKEEALNANCRFLQGENTSNDAIDKIRDAIKNKTQVTVDLLNYTKKGEPFWNRLLVFPVLDQQGNVSYFVGIQQDITKAKKQVNYIDGITKASPACLAYVDYDGRYQFVNETYTKWYDKPASYFIGKTVEEIFPEDVYQTFEANINKAMIGKGSSYETVYPKPDGDDRFVRGTFIPDIDEFGNAQGFFVTVEDISGFKITEQAQQRAVEAAEEANTAKSEFLASMSHEIRTPLNGVMGMLDLLSSSELNDIQAKRAKLAKSSAESLLSIINDILDFSKIDAGKMELDKIEFDVINLLSDYVETVASLAANNQTEITLDTVGIKQRNIIADPVRIQQIIANITGNAIKFTKGGTILVKASLIESSQGYQLTCDIQDTGIGIPEDKIPKLFESFSQVDASTTRKFGGTGLGLTIVKQLCQLMGGDITVRSKLDEGSIFSFHIPITVDTKQSVNTLDLSDCHVLIVDNNELNLHVLKNQLSVWGATISVSNSAPNALDQLELSVSTNNPVDLILVDRAMPDMSGTKFAQEIKSNDQFADIKMILMTAIDQHETIEEYAQMGFSSYCVKPVTANDLTKSITTILSHERDGLSAELEDTPHHESESIKFSDIDHAPLLLVEDNKVNQLVAKGILKNLGFNEIGLAENGHELIKKLTEYETTPIILMDCQMPIMDGYEATRAVRQGQAGELHKDAVIIAMTANAMSGDKEKCIKAGMDDYMSKPIRSEILLSKLKRYIEYV